MRESAYSPKAYLDLVDRVLKTYQKRFGDAAVPTEHYGGIEEALDAALTSLVEGKPIDAPMPPPGADF